MIVFIVSLCLNGFFCPTKTPKPKYSSFTKEQSNKSSH